VRPPHLLFPTFFLLLASTYPFAFLLGFTLYIRVCWFIAPSAEKACFEICEVWSRFSFQFFPLLRVLIPPLSPFYFFFACFPFLTFVGVFFDENLPPALPSCTLDSRPNFTHPALSQGQPQGLISWYPPYFPKTFSFPGYFGPEAIEVLPAQALYMDFKGTFERFDTVSGSSGRRELNCKDFFPRCTCWVEFVFTQIFPTCLGCFFFTSRLGGPIASL